MKQEKILVVDDEALVRETIRVDLMEAGYDVVEARNGLEGVRQFKNGAIDLVISGLVMDEMDGLGVLKKIKKISPDNPCNHYHGLSVTPSRQGSPPFRRQRNHQQTRRHGDNVPSRTPAYAILKPRMRSGVLPFPKR